MLPHIKLTFIPVDSYGGYSLDRDAHPVKS